jgi:hypothetical protein
MLLEIMECLTGYALCTEYTGHTVKKNEINLQNVL